MHVVTSENQVPNDLDDASGVAEAVAGDVVGEDEAVPGRRHSTGLLRLEPHSLSLSKALLAAGDVMEEDAEKRERERSYKCRKARREGRDQDERERIETRRKMAWELSQQQIRPTSTT